MEVQSFGKRGIHYGEQEHDPRGRPGEAEQRGCDLQSARGILYQSIVERETGKILELDCNTILDVTKRFVASMFVGKSLKTDIPSIEKEIRERYFALTQKPLIACMKDACNRYLTAIGENCPQKKS